MEGTDFGGDFLVWPFACVEVAIGFYAGLCAGLGCSAGGAGEDAVCHAYKGCIEIGDLIKNYHEQGHFVRVVADQHWLFCSLG